LPNLNKKEERYSISFNVVQNWEIIYSRVERSQGTIESTLST
jgi:hypothetical protein